MQQQDWAEELCGKTLRAIRGRHKEDGTPFVYMMTEKDGALEHYEIHTSHDGIYFEGALINTLRKTAEIVGVNLYEGNYRTTLDIVTKGYPLVILRTMCKEGVEGPFPLTLVRTEGRGWEGR